jgi:hypothetical protein
MTFVVKLAIAQLDKKLRPQLHNCDENSYSLPLSKFKATDIVTDLLKALIYEARKTRC